MYLAFYGLREPPFRLAPDPRFLWRGAPVAAALDGLAAKLVGRRGVACLAGAPGLGKSTLLRHLAGSLPASLHTILVPDPAPPFTPLDHLLVELGIPHDGPLPERRRALAAHLERQARAGRGVVLLVDDAPALADAARRMLERLAALRTADDRPALQLVVAGPDVPAAPACVATATLHPLGPGDVRDYVACRLQRAGGRGLAPFTDAAVARLATLSGGVPRTLHLLADATLVHGCAQREAALGPGTVDAAWARLGAADAPQAAPRHATAGTPVLLPPAERRPVRRRARRRGRILLAATAAAGVALAAIAGLRDRAAPGVAAPHAVAGPRRPTPDEALDAVARWRTAWERRDVRAMTSLLAPDAEVDGRRGADAAPAAWAGVDPGAHELAWLQPTATVEPVAPHAMAVHARFVTAWRGRDGRPREVDGTAHWTVEAAPDGPRIVRVVQDRDPPPDAVSSATAPARTVRQ